MVWLSQGLLRVWLRPNSVPASVMVLTLILWSVVFVGCLAAPEPPGPGQSTGDASSVNLEPGDLLPHMTWYAGPYSGTFALRLVVSFLEETSCNGTFAGHGTTDHLAPTIAFQAWPNMTEDGFPRGPLLIRGQGSLMEPHGGVHAASVFDQGIGGDNRWAVSRQFTMEGLEGGTYQILFAGDVVALDTDDIPAWGDAIPHDSSAMMRIGCDGPVRVDAIHIGQQARFFDEATLDDGAGVHVSGLGTTGVQAAGIATLDLQTEMGYLAAGTSGDILLNHVGVGVIQVKYPGGSDMWIDRPTQVLAELALYTVTGEPPHFLLDHIYEAESGTYALEATYGSVDVTSELQGVILGFDNAKSLDELGFGLTDYGHTEENVAT